MKLRHIASLIIGLYGLAAHAMEPFVVKDIRVEGIRRTDAGTVFNYLPVQVGSRVRQEDFPELIRALFRTGFFTDVESLCGPCLE